MDKLAVELITLIAFFACTDGGRTGCSLALVSKQVNYASRPARFYSVSLINSADQIDLFLELYLKERARAVDSIPRVRHLCLSFFGRGLDPTRCSSRSATAPTAITTPGLSLSLPKSRAEWLAAQQRRAQQWSSTQNNLDAHYNRVIPALMHAVAPDIWTLAIMQTQWRSGSVLECHFPRLEELSLVGGDPSFLPFDRVPSDKPLYPALKRLHHIISPMNNALDLMQWAQHAPNLTHLRISRLDYNPHMTVGTLLQVMSSSESDDIFPHLQKIVVQPQSRPASSSDGQFSTVTLSYDDFLTRLGKAACKARVPVILLPAMDNSKIPLGVDPSRGCILKLQGVWMDRIEGGPGVWERPISEPEDPNVLPGPSEHQQIQRDGGKEDRSG